MSRSVTFTSVLLAALAVSGSADGSASCPCIPDIMNHPGLSLSGYLSGGRLGYNYPPGSSTRYTVSTTYGSGTCAQHDAGTAPMCNSQSPPGWCRTPWCYVDPTNCDTTRLKSRLFPEDGLYFSYMTCAGSGGDSGSSAEWTASSIQGTRQMIELIETYTRNSRDVLEDHFTNMTAGAVCESEEMCPAGSCSTCRTFTGWGAVDFTQVGMHEGACVTGQSCTQEDKQRAVCLSGAVADTYARVAGKEADADRMRIGYQYFADQRTGTYTQWPKADNSALCESNYDPRARPWYAAGATGPKDVVIVVDVSGSMGEMSGDTRRYVLAQQAAKAVLDVLTWKDFATIVLFNSYVKAKYSETLVPVTESNRAAMKAWIDSGSGSWDSGGTNFGAALTGSMQVIAASVAAGATSMCQKAILFLTDGVDSSFEDFSVIQTEATKYGASIFSYALGSGADTEKPKRLACENRGIFYAVPDGSDLRSIMSRFYEYFVQGQELCSASFIKYASAGTGSEQYAGCLPMYNKTSPSAGLLGVTCIDVNLVENVADMKQEAGWQHFVCQASDMTKRCRQVDLSECQLQKMRLAYSPSSVCDASTVTEETVCGCTDANCQDDPNYVDAKNYFCDTWVGDNCDLAAEEWGYTSTQEQEIKQKCRRSCGLCPDKPPSECTGQRTSSAECETIAVEDTCRACRGTMSGVDIEGNAMHCPGAATTTTPPAAAGDGGGSTANGGQRASLMGAALWTVALAALAPCAPAA